MQIVIWNDDKYKALEKQLIEEMIRLRGVDLNSSESAFEDSGISITSRVLFDKMLEYFSALRDFVLSSDFPEVNSRADYDKLIVSGKLEGLIKHAEQLPGLVGNVPNNIDEAEYINAFVVVSAIYLGKRLSMRKEPVSNESTKINSERTSTLDKSDHELLAEFARETKSVGNKVELGLSYPFNETVHQYVSALKIFPRLHANEVVGSVLRVIYLSPVLREYVESRECRTEGVEWNSFVDYVKSGDIGVDKSEGRTDSGTEGGIGDGGLRR